MPPVDLLQYVPYVLPYIHAVRDMSNCWRSGAQRFGSPELYIHMTDVSGTGPEFLARDRSPFLNIGATMASFHCCGIIPDFIQS